MAGGEARGAARPTRRRHCRVHMHYARGCEPCREYAYWCLTTRRDAIRAGTWRPMGDRATLAEVRGHMARIREAGGSMRWLSARSGVSEVSLSEIYNGAHRVQIKPDVADAILGVFPPELPTPPAGLTWAAGSQRRAMGLAVDGISLSEQARRLGAGKLCVLRWVNDCAPTDFVRSAHAAKMAVLVDELADLPGSDRVRQEAERRGWLSLDAWSDIDDPLCEPVDGSGWIDEVLVREIVAWRGLRHRPACWEGHSKGRAYRNCRACFAWRANRDEAIRRASLLPPYGPGLSADQLAERVGETERTVTRARRDLSERAYAALYAAIATHGREDGPGER